MRRREFTKLFNQHCRCMAVDSNILAAEMDGKRLGLLHELMPNALRVGVLLNPNFPAYTEQLNDLQHAAKIINLQVEILRANTDGEIDAAFEFSSQKHLEALVLTASPFFDTRRDKLVALAAGHALPTIYHFREFAVAGGLMSYGVSIPHIYRQIGVYAGRILKGDNPANLPVQTPTKFELVINLKTAKMLRLTIPQSMLLVADEVIE
jgi:putative ABC transport system substrate-binding protein